MASERQEAETTRRPDADDELARQLVAQQEQIRGLELQVVDALAKVDALSRERCHTSSTVPPSEVDSSLVDNALEQLEEGTGAGGSGSASNEGKAGSRTAITPARLDVGDAYALNMSIWDSMLFCGHPGLGGSVSVVTLLAYVFNVGSQFAFCYMIWNYMLEPDVNSSALETLLKFRLSIAHNVEFADPMTKQSLAQQVCNTNEKVHYAAGQMDILKDVKRFLNGGPQLMILAEIIFLCVIVKELDAIAQFTKAVMSLRTSHKTRVVLADSSEHEVHDPAERCKAEDLYLVSVVTRIEKIRPLRVYFAWALIIVPRVIICLVLGITGVRFIGKTNNVDDLILNCLAIAFVIDLDELIYECLAPRRLKTLMNNVEPIPCHAPEYLVTRRHAPVMSPVLKVFFLIASVVTAYYLVLGRFFWQLSEVDHILCSQDSHLDFVYARNSANNIIYVAKSQKTDDWTADEVTMMEVANLDIEATYDWSPGILAKQKELRTGSEKGPPAIVLGHSVALVSNTTYDASIYEALEELGDSPLQRAANSLVCQDLGSRSEFHSYLAALRELMQNTSISTCADVPWELCGRREMTQLRALCPVRCSCHVPPTYEIDSLRALAGYFQSPQGGCPQSCQSQVKTSNEMHFVRGPAPFSDGIGSTAGRCTDLGADAFVVGGSGSMKSSVECLVNGTVAADCSGLPPDALWWLTFTAGLFEHLAADVAFPDIVDGAVPLVFQGIAPSMMQDLAKWISNGSLALSFLDGEWELMPGLPHPRGLTGCDYLASFEVRMLLNIDLCSVDEYSSIRFMCPVSCGCSAGGIYRQYWDNGYDNEYEYYYDYGDEARFSLMENLHMVSNRMEDLSSCPAACVMVHPTISGDGSYDLIGNQSGNSADVYAECADLGPEWAADSFGDTCLDWAMEEYFCEDDWDDTDFTVADMCCWCGGGAGAA